MSKKYIGKDYILHIYSKNLEDVKSMKPVQSGAVTDYDFTKSTGSLESSGDPVQYQYENMIFASRSATTALSNRLFTHPKVGRHDGSASDRGSFGGGVVISGSIMAVLHKGNLDNSHQDNYRGNQGIFFFKSGSSGWEYSNSIFPAVSLYPRTNNDDEDVDGFAVGRSFHMHGKFAAFAALVDGVWTSEDDNDKLFIYRTGSGGWSLEETLTTASFTPNQWVYTNPSTDYYTRNGTYGLFGGVKIYDNKIVVGSMDFNDRLPSNVKYNGVSVFKSSSASGWVFERFLTSSHAHAANSNVDDDYRKGLGSNAGGWSGNLDFDGTRVIAGGYGGFDSAPFIQDNGRIGIWKDTADGWIEETQIDLKSAGLTSVVPVGTGASQYNIYNLDGGSGFHAGAQEWKMYSKFGFFSCAISGSYFAASAEGYKDGGDSRSYVKNRIFIFKSSSTSGWEMQTSLKSPNPNTGGTGSLGSNSYDDKFGYHLAFNRSLPGMLVTRSPEYDDPSGAGSSPKNQGRVHIYKSSSADGWYLAQNIENPYSGSAVHTDRTGYSKYGHHPSEDERQHADQIGFDGGLLAVPFSKIQVSENDTGTALEQTRWGAIHVLHGKAVSDTTTESAPVAGFGPFIKAVNGPMNLRLQSGSNSPYSSNLGKSENPS